MEKLTTNQRQRVNDAIEDRTLQGDPLNVNPRLYKQVAKLLDDMEAADANEVMTMPQRISSLIAIGRLLKMFQDLRKGDANVDAGSAVAKYAAAFAAQANGTGQRAGSARRVIVELDPSTSPADDDFEDDAA